MIAAIGLAGVAAIAGGALSAFGAISQSRAAAKASEFQARVLQQQAVRERDISAAEERDFRKRQRALLAQRKAEMGASGIRFGTGSPLISMEDFERETELQAQRIRSGGETTASRLEQQAGLERMAGRNARSRGVFRAGASLLTGIGTAFS